MDTREIIRRAGGPSKVAEAVGRDHSTVCGWATVPPRHVRTVARLAGLHPSDIRPDLYDAPQAAPEAA